MLGYDELFAILDENRVRFILMRYGYSIHQLDPIRAYLADKYVIVRRWGPHKKGVFMLWERREINELNKQRRAAPAKQPPKKQIKGFTPPTTPAQ